MKRCCDRKKSVLPFSSLAPGLQPTALRRCVRLPAFLLVSRLVWNALVLLFSGGLVFPCRLWSYSEIVSQLVRMLCPPSRLVSFRFVFLSLLSQVLPSFLYSTDARSCLKSALQCNSLVFEGYFCIFWAAATRPLRSPPSSRLARLQTLCWWDQRAIVQRSEISTRRSGFFDKLPANAQGKDHQKGRCRSARSLWANLYERDSFFLAKPKRFDSVHFHATTMEFLFWPLAMVIASTLGALSAFWTSFVGRVTDATSLQRRQRWRKSWGSWGSNTWHTLGAWRHGRLPESEWQLQH